MQQFKNFKTDVNCIGNLWRPVFVLISLTGKHPFQCCFLFSILIFPIIKFIEFCFQQSGKRDEPEVKHLTLAQLNARRKHAKLMQELISRLVNKSKKSKKRAMKSKSVKQYEPRCWIESFWPICMHITNDYVPIQKSLSEFAKILVDICWIRFINCLLYTSDAADE